MLDDCNVGDSRGGDNEWQRMTNDANCLCIKETVRLVTASHYFSTSVTMGRNRNRNRKRNHSVAVGNDDRTVERYNPPVEDLRCLILEKVRQRQNQSNQSKQQKKQKKNQLRKSNQSKKPSRRRRNKAKRDGGLDIPGFNVQVNVSFSPLSSSRRIQVSQR